MIRREGRRAQLEIGETRERVGDFSGRGQDLSAAAAIDAAVHKIS